jgi:hypothetical protein
MEGRPATLWLRQRHGDGKTGAERGRSIAASGHLRAVRQTTSRGAQPGCLAERTWPPHAAGAALEHAGGPYGAAESRLPRRGPLPRRAASGTPRRARRARPLRCRARGTHGERRGLLRAALQSLRLLASGNGSLRPLWQPLRGRRGARTQRPLPLLHLPGPSQVRDQRVQCRSTVGASAGGSHPRGATPHVRSARPARQGR